MKDELAELTAAPNTLARSVRVDIPAINRWATELGWTNDDFAKCAEVTRRTIERMRETGRLGRPSYGRLLENLQRALITRARRIDASKIPEMPCTLELPDYRTTLTAQVRAQISTKEESTQPEVCMIELKLPKAKMESISEDDRDRLIRVIQAVLGVDEPVHIHSYANGSVKIRIVLPQDHALRLKGLVDAGYLASDGITEASMISIKEIEGSEPGILKSPARFVRVTDYVPVMPLSSGQVDENASLTPRPDKEWQYEVTSKDAAWVPKIPAGLPETTRLSVKSYPQYLAILVGRGFLRFGKNVEGSVIWFSGRELVGEAEWPHSPATIVIDSPRRPAKGDSLMIELRYAEPHVAKDTTVTVELGF